MKNTRPHIDAEPGVLEQLHCTGNLPAQQSTVVAEVLADLLDGRHISSLNAVYASNTTRLASAIHQLSHEWEWVIERYDKRVSTRDGRSPEVRLYYLSPECIAQAMARGAAHWVRQVREARADKRSKAGRALDLDAA